SGNWLNKDDATLFAHFLTGKNLTSLRNLYVSHVGLDDNDVTALAATPWVGRLKWLDLRANAIGEEGALALLRSPWLEQIEWLGLKSNPLWPSQSHDSPITPGTQQLLRQRFGTRVDL
ncbi:MAG: hypothetical protein K2V38_11890, partial [Gemmataceae bacterium]|nr:hypothetical protein [Gemmataceae bacterium]